MTIRDLIEMLQDAAIESPDGEDAEVKFASQPSWPFEYSISDCVTTEAGVVYLAEGQQLAYLDSEVVELLGW